MPDANNIWKIMEKREWVCGSFLKKDKNFKQTITKNPKSVKKKGKKEGKERRHITHPDLPLAVCSSSFRI